MNYLPWLEEHVVQPASLLLAVLIHCNRGSLGADMSENSSLLLQRKSPSRLRLFRSLMCLGFGISGSIFTCPFTVQRSLVTILCASHFHGLLFPHEPSQSWGPTSLALETVGIVAGHRSEHALNLRSPRSSSLSRRVTSKVALPLSFPLFSEK